MATSIDSIARNHIWNPIKNLWWSFFAKIVNNFYLSTVFAKSPTIILDCVAWKKKSKLNNFTCFYMLYDFINCPAFVDIALTNLALWSRNRVNLIKEMFLCIVSYVCFAFLCWIKFLVVLLDRLFFIWKTKKVVAGHIKQVVVLYCNDFMGICLGRLSIGYLRQVVAALGRLTEVVLWTGLTVML